jgi:hypothetical protein
MTKEHSPQAGDPRAEPESEEVTRRGLLKKTIYQTPALLVLGSLASVETAVAASPCGVFPNPPCEPSRPELP